MFFCSPRCCCSNTAEGSVGSGLGPSFAAALLAKNAIAGRIGLVPCAFGGSPLSRWEKVEEEEAPAPADQHADDAQGLPPNPGVPGDLYSRAWRRGLAALAAHPRATLRGFLWHQGESDTDDAEKAATLVRSFTLRIRFPHHASPHCCRVRMRRWVGPSIRFVDSQVSGTTDQTNRELSRRSCGRKRRAVYPRYATHLPT